MTRSEAASTQPVLSIDAMGGDHAPLAIVDGVDIVARRRSGFRCLLHGPQATLTSLLAERPAARAAATIVAADGVIGMDVKPSQALRQGKGSSLWSAVQAVETGQAQACVSAGNTGAYMAIAMLRLRLVPGVHRPALVAQWPTLRGVASVLDVGATVEADASQLVEFAIMGAAFHRAVHGVANPTVGLLNVGAEDQKGHEEIRAAAKLIRASAVDLEFRGFVEGDDIARGATDVVVTDGFTGNVALKTAEGTARMVSAFLREALTSSMVSKLGALIAAPALRQLKRRMDPGAVNGAVFLGVNGLVVKSHGGTDAQGFASAVDVAVRMVNSTFREEVAANLARLEAAHAAPEPATAGDPT